jgi:DNA polymerase III alpha subunit
MGRGDAVGVGQIEAALSRRVLTRVKPADVREVADALALARPGCAAARDMYLKRRCGKEQVTYAHPSMERALSATPGTLLYEDDAVTLLEAVGGLNGTEADRLRCRFAAGDVEAAAELVAACARVNVPEASARAVAAMLRAQEVYSFCKAHALAVASVGVAVSSASAGLAAPGAFASTTGVVGVGERLESNQRCRGHEPRPGTAPSRGGDGDGRGRAGVW